MAFRDDSEDMAAALTVSNEFTRVCVRKVKTAQGDRLELSLPKTGAFTRLDALQLEAIVSLPPEAFTQFIQASHG